jgi:hypothetical protein
VFYTGLHPCEGFCPFTEVLFVILCKSYMKTVGLQRSQILSKPTKPCKKEVMCYYQSQLFSDTRKLPSSWWQLQVFQNSNFHLKTNFITPNKYCQRIIILKSEEPVCQLFSQKKNAVSSKRNVHLRNHRGAFFVKSTSYFIMHTHSVVCFPFPHTDCGKYVGWTEGMPQTGEPFPCK